MVIPQARAALDISTHGANGSVWIVLLTFTCLRPRAATVFTRHRQRDADEFIVRDIYFTLFIYYLNLFQKNTRHLGGNYLGANFCSVFKTTRTQHSVSLEPLRRTLCEQRLFLEEP